MFTGAESSIDGSAFSASTAEPNFKGEPPSGVTKRVAGYNMQKRIFRACRQEQTELYAHLFLAISAEKSSNSKILVPFSTRGESHFL